MKWSCPLPTLLMCCADAHLVPTNRIPASVGFLFLAGKVLLFLTEGVPHLPYLHLVTENTTFKIESGFSVTSWVFGTMFELLYLMNLLYSHT